MEHPVPTCHSVLLVEDDQAVREMVAEFLRSEGFWVEEVGDGAEAVRALDAREASGHYCLVLLDVNLPEVDGIGVLRHLAAEGDWVPVVAMSASSRHLAAAADSGARATVVKPFELDGLLDVVTRHCGHQRCR